MKERKLTVKELSFIDAYVGEAAGNATKAYELSMYSSRGTKSTLVTEIQRLMARPIIKNEIEKRLRERSARVEERFEINANYLINKLMQIIEAEQDRNPQAALRAVELAGKSIALWKERQEISGPDGTAIQHEQHVKESVADFTSKLEQLKSRGNSSGNDPTGASNVVGFPDRRAESGT